MKINNYRTYIDNDNKNPLSNREEEKKTTIVKKYISKNQDLSALISNKNSKILNRDNLKTNSSIMVIDNTKKKIIRKREKNVFLLEFENAKMYNFENFEFAKLGDELNMIGKGAYSEVFLAKNKINEKYYAIKKIKKYNLKSSSEKLPAEILIHRRIIHENIVRAYSHYEDKEFYYLTQEFINNGNLYHKIIQSGCGLSEAEAYLYFKQVLNALEFLHENHLVHRDLKPENILITKKDKVKLCDFGCCVDIRSGFRETFCGTFEYMAPEIIKELPYNQAVDIWSLGILLYEMLHGHSPFCNKNEDENERDLSQIFKNILIKKLSFKDGVSDMCRDLINKLLSKKNEDRIKIQEIKNHPWCSYQRDLDLKHNEQVSENTNLETPDKPEIQFDLSILNEKPNENFLIDENKISNNSNLEENKIEKASKDDSQKQTKLKLLKENIQSKKNLLEQNVGLAVNLPNLDMQQNERKSQPMNNAEKKEAGAIKDKSIDFDDFSSLSKIMKRKHEKTNNKIKKELNLYEEDELGQDLNADRNYKNINNDLFEEIANNDFNLYNEVENNKSSNENIFLVDKDIHKNSNHFNLDYDSNNNRASNQQEELFEKVLDNIKYKKKKKPCKKTSGEKAEFTDKRKSIYNNSILTTENSIRPSHGRNSETIKNEHYKSSTENLKAGLSSDKTGERNSDQVNTVLNRQLIQKSFKDILKGEGEENFNKFNSNLKNNYSNNSNIDYNDKDNYYTNNHTENNYFDDRLGFNLLNDDNEKEFKNVNSKEPNFLELCRVENYKKIKSNSKFSLDFKSNNKFNNKNMLFNNKKEEIRRNIEKEKIKNAQNFTLNFEQQERKTNLELMDENINYENYSYVNKMSLTPKNNNDKLIFSKKIKEKQNPNLFKSMNPSDLSRCFKRDINKSLIAGDSKDNNNFINNDSVLIEKSNFEINRKLSNANVTRGTGNRMEKMSHKDSVKSNENKYHRNSVEDENLIISDRVHYPNYDEYGTNRRNQDRTLELLKQAKMKKECLSFKTEEKQEDGFWKNMGNFFGIFQCNTKK